jgi:hypothetical protein
MKLILTNSGTSSKEDIEASVNKYILHKVCKRKYKLPWITQELKSLIQKRDRAYKKKKKSNHPQDTKKFKHLEQTIQRKSRQAYWKYIEEIVTPENNEEVHSLPKRFWTYIKHKKSDKCGVAPRKNGRLETDPINKANILNEQFQSVFSPSTNIDREEF